jgi:CheY-like chemotaxis protein
LKTKLLYIEDDVVDILAIKRVLKSFEDIALFVCSTFNDLQNLDLSDYDAIISDSNLADADYIKLKRHMGGLANVQFVSGSGIAGEPIWLKPINKENIETLFCFRSVMDLDYIENLAQGDADFEIDMIETALRILPERLDEMKKSIESLKDLKLAAHRTKSSYRVCGIDATALNEVEEMSEIDFCNKVQLEALLKSIYTTTTKAISELETLLLSRVKKKN